MASNAKAGGFAVLSNDVLGFQRGGITLNFHQVPEGTSTVALFGVAMALVGCACRSRIVSRQTNN